MNRWKEVWNNHSADKNIIQEGTEKEILIELKRAIGNDVVGNGIPYESLIQEYVELKKMLSNKQEICSVYEVGCGSGANLWLFEKEGIISGGLDYSNSLIENAHIVCKSNDIICDEASHIDLERKYDAVFAMRVFSYFENNDYAREVLVKMCKKSNYSVGLIDVHDECKKDDFLKFRRINIEDYDKKYIGLEKLFYRRDFFIEIAEKLNMEIVFQKQDTQGYWNNEFGFNVFLYHK